MTLVMFTEDHLVMVFNKRKGFIKCVNNVVDHRDIMFYDRVCRRNQVNLGVICWGSLWGSCSKIKSGNLRPIRFVGDH